MPNPAFWKDLLIRFIRFPVTAGARLFAGRWELFLDNPAMPPIKRTQILTKFAAVLAEAGMGAGARDPTNAGKYWLDVLCHDERHFKWTSQNTCWVQDLPWVSAGYCRKYCTFQGPGKPPKGLTFNGKILRSLRRRHNLTQEQFAELCELSCDTIYRAERDMPLSAKAFKAIMKAIHHLEPDLSIRIMPQK
jgi:DNA-binding XRE family transcriptional regulator